MKQINILTRTIIDGKKENCVENKKDKDYIKNKEGIRKSLERKLNLNENYLRCYLNIIIFILYIRCQLRRDSYHNIQK